MHLPLTGAILFYSGCKKENTDIGKYILPGPEQINTSAYNTVNFKTWYFHPDTFTTYRQNTSQAGTYLDNIFGQVTAGFLTQLSLSTDSIDFPDTSLITVVSVLFSIKITGVYGINSSPQVFNIYRINEMPPSGNYDYTPDYGTTVVHSFVYPDDTVIIDDEEFINVLLPVSFGEEIISGGSYVSNDDFQSLFKGLYIKPEAIDNGSIIHFSRTDNTGYIRLSYKINATDENYIYDLLLNDAESNWMNLFENDYSSTEFYAHIGDSSYQDTVMYLQASAGLLGRINMSPLLTWRDSGNVAICEAKLTLPVADFSFPLPQLELRKVTDDGITKTLIKTVSYNSATHSYDCMITDYIQDLIQSEYDEVILELWPDNFYEYSSRVVLSSGTNSNPMKLTIKYIKG